MINLSDIFTNVADMCHRYLNVPKREIKWGGTKLVEKGFVYRYDKSMILNDCVDCARKHGDLQK